MTPLEASAPPRRSTPAAARSLSDRAWRLLAAAWAVALAATLGALFIGEVMGKAPCVLCWHQRIAMFPLALILGIACLGSERGVVRYALPLALIGLALALWHSLVFVGVVPQAIQPCAINGPSCSGEGMKVLGLPIPFLSLAAFAAIAALLEAFRRTP